MQSAFLTTSYKPSSYGGTYVGQEHMSNFDIRYYEETFKQEESGGVEHIYAYSGSYILDSTGKKHEMTKLAFAQDKNRWYYKNDLNGEAEASL